jgi:hypothetical protein
MDLFYTVESTSVCLWLSWKFSLIRFCSGFPLSFLVIAWPQKPDHHSRDTYIVAIHKWCYQCLLLPYWTLPTWCTLFFSPRHNQCFCPRRWWHHLWTALYEKVSYHLRQDQRLKTKLTILCRKLVCCHLAKYFFWRTKNLT